MNYTVRHTAMEDIPVCMELFDAARGIMRRSGNMNQWTDGYPSREVLENDIRNADSYVVCDLNNVPVATFACIVGEDPNILDKYGFSRRGIIHLANGDPRIAYQYFNL